MVNYTRYRAGYSGLSKIIVGKDGWLFYGPNINEGIGTQRFTPSSLRDWMTGFEKLNAYAKARGAFLYVLPASQQETIYPEKLPEWLARGAQPTIDLDQILDAGHQIGNDAIIDARAALKAAKASRAVYGPYDLHWNGNGAYVAYRALMERVSRDFPNVEPLAQEKFRGRRDTQNNLALMLGIGNFVTDEQTVYADAPVHDPARTTYMSERKGWDAPQILQTDGPSLTLLMYRNFFDTVCFTTQAALQKDDPHSH